MTRTNLDILTAIKPQFANPIYDGIKTLEFRKRVSKQLFQFFIKNGNKQNVKMFLYESNPVKRITGYIMVDYIFSLNKRVIEMFHKAHPKSFGIKLDELYQYFGINESTNERKPIGYGIQIYDAVKFEKPISLWDVDIKYPPQDFIHLTPYDVEKLNRAVMN